MTTVQNIALSPGGTPLSINVRITLQTGASNLPGYLTSSDISAVYTTSTAQDGSWSANLTPNSEITPANTYYQVYEGSALSNIVVPASGGPYSLSEILVTEPPTPSAVGITGVQVAADGTVAGVRPEINVIAGSGITVTATDNPADARVDVTVSSTGGGSVDSVNGETGVVVLTAADVGADASGAAATAQSNAESFATAAVATETSRAEAAEATKLSAANNLSDVASPATAFANIKQAATTSATGVVQLEGNAAAIQPLAQNAAAGSTGLAADAGHVHPAGVITVPAPTGATATDTPNIQAAITTLSSVGGGYTLKFQDGVYQVDSNALVIRNCANFALQGTGATVIAQAPNRAALPLNITGNVFTIADCTDFRINGITFDGLRDTVAPLAPLTVAPTSGASSVTVAAGAAAPYFAGSILSVNGGLGSSDQNTFQQNLTVQSVTPGGGTGGGDLITFTGTITSTYTVVSNTPVSDGFGPYAYAGVYLSPFDTGNATVAGRSLVHENMQNGLHLMNCQRFAVVECTARGVWNSNFKTGTGFATTSLTDGCTQGTFSACHAYHGYDQGFSLWASKNISVTGCTANATGWAGISLTQSDDCAITGNQVLNPVNRTWGDTSGSGIVSEGGIHNQITGNVVNAPWEDCIRLTNSPMGWGYSSTNAPTLTGYLAAQTGAGTSIAVSATSNFQVGAAYSICDGARTEAIVIASVVDSTHITLMAAVNFSHPSGTYIVNRISQENTVVGNTLTGYVPGGGAAANGVLGSVAVRSIIAHNVIRSWALGSGGSGSGITLSYSNGGSASLPTGIYLAGHGTQIQGNVLGSGAGPAITADSSANLLIRGNKVHGALNNSAALTLNGITDSVIEANVVTDGEKRNGILTQAGGQSATVCARLSIIGNIVRNTAGEGLCLTSGTSLTIVGNTISSCGGNAGIDLRGIQHSIVSGNIANSNQADGILLENNASVFCLYNTVSGNTCRDDGSGFNITTGVAWTQQNGIVEAGSSNDNTFTGNEVDGNASTQLTVIGAGSYAYGNIVSGTVATAIAAANLPAATTTTQGAVIIDGTATDIAPLGTQAAGSIGKAADAGHVHPTTGLVLASQLPLSLTNGGTGATSQQAALNALAGGATSGDYLRGNGTNMQLSPILAADLPAASASTQGAVVIDGTAADIVAAANAPAAGSVGKAADAGHVHPMNNGPAAEDDFVAWAFDVAYMGSTAVVPGVGTLALIRVPVRTSRTFSKVWVPLASNGSSLTTGGNWVGLYNSAGALVAASADQTTTWGTGSFAVEQTAMTAQSGFSLTLAAGFYWVALLTNATGTGAGFARGASINGTLVNGSTPAPYRWSSYGSGLTTLPANITLSSATHLQTTFWTALA